MTKIVYAAIIISLMALAASGYAGYRSTQQKYGYVELKKVFDEFEMTKQNSKKLESVVNQRKLITDSIELGLRSAARSLAARNIKSGPEAENFLVQKDDYMDMKKKYDEDNNVLKTQYNAEITKQLNQYVKDYGDKNGYDFVLGADGSGGIMYAAEQLNITNDVIKYVNARYQGISK